MVSVFFNYQVSPKYSITDQDIIDFMETKGLALAAIEYHENMTSIKFWKPGDTTNQQKRKLETTNEQNNKKIKR